MPIKKISEHPDEDDDAAGRHMSGSGTQAQAANEPNGARAAKDAEANDSNEAQA